MADVPGFCPNDGCSKPFGHQLDPDDAECGRATWCNWCDLRLRRSIADRHGQTLVAVAVGDRHARPAAQFKEGPVIVFLDGVRQVRYDVLPRTCTC